MQNAQNANSIAVDPVVNHVRIDQFPSMGVSKVISSLANVGIVAELLDRRRQPLSLPVSGLGAPLLNAVLPDVSDIVPGLRGNDDPRV
jgi:hypothetical protein